ncbi:hypothetical protein OPT61_g1227 [Boeremia exigua]|uniref:Uncharacterized protein n=1 Tax=Boeremia exigua TaxID=749465 RepID=A0ACC2IR79_9PLEO|nr:hypothetical protein OPT61_g1227 [Boeremia exigua]
MLEHQGPNNQTTLLPAVFLTIKGQEATTGFLLSSSPSPRVLPASIFSSYCSLLAVLSSRKTRCLAALGLSPSTLLSFCTSVSHSHRPLRAYCFAAGQLKKPYTLQNPHDVTTTSEDAMALLSAEHLAGPGYIILNIQRALNIIALASVVASSIVMLVKTFIVSKPYSWFRNFGLRHDGPRTQHVGQHEQGGHKPEVFDIAILEALGGVRTNQNTDVQQSYIFCDRSRGITARRVRSRGAMTLSEVDAESQHYDFDPKHKAFTISTHHTGSSASRSHIGQSPPMRNGTPPMRMASPPVMGAPTPRVDCGSPQLESPQQPTNHLSAFAFSPISAFKSVRGSFLPSYHSTSPPKPGFLGHRPSSSIYSRTTYGGEPSKKKFWQRMAREEEPEVPRVPAEISGPMNINPQFAHLVKPNLAHHPSIRRPEADFDKI